MRHKSKRHDSDSDISPPRHQNKSAFQVKHKSKRHNSDSDISPPRHQNKSDSQVKHKLKRHDSDSDISPSRHQNIQTKSASRRHDSDTNDTFSKNHSSVKNRLNSLNDNKQKKKEKNSDSDISPPRLSSELSSTKGKTKKLGKTLSGLKAGLQNSATLQREVHELKKREMNQLNILDEEVSGRNADTVIRDRKTGLKRDLHQEQGAKNEKNKKAKELQAKYAHWGKGIEQTEHRKEKFEEDLYEMSKPLARYQDDKDLDERLKLVIHDDDPMSEYIKKKRQKDTPSVPVYTGPPAPPNRFGILPGFRWDGVDRSNGFERKYFEKINKSKAIESEAYLWSVQDM